jgi:hypothetical protein
MKAKLIPVDGVVAKQLIPSWEHLVRLRKELTDAVRVANEGLESSHVAPYVADGMKRKLRKRGKCRIVVSDDGQVYLELQVRKPRSGKPSSENESPVEPEKDSQTEPEPEPESEEDFQVDPGEDSQPEPEPESEEDLDDYPSVGVLLDLAEKQGLAVADRQPPKKRKMVKKAVALTEAEEIDPEEWDDLF